MKAFDKGYWYNFDVESGRRLNPAARHLLELIDDDSTCGGETCIYCFPEQIDQATYKSVMETWWSNTAGFYKVTEEDRERDALRSHP